MFLFNHQSEIKSIQAHIYRERKKCTDIVSFNSNDYSDGFFFELVMGLNFCDEKSEQPSFSVKHQKSALNNAQYSKGKQRKEKRTKTKQTNQRRSKIHNKKLIKVIVQSSIHRPYYLIEIEFQENKIHRVETRCDRQKGTPC